MTSLGWEGQWHGYKTARLRPLIERSQRKRFNWVASRHVFIHARIVFIFIHTYIYMDLERLEGIPCALDSFYLSFSWLFFIYFLLFLTKASISFKYFGDGWDTATRLLNATGKLDKLRAQQRFTSTQTTTKHNYSKTLHKPAHTYSTRTKALLLLTMTCVDRERQKEKNTHCYARFFCLWLLFTIDILLNKY